MTRTALLLPISFAAVLGLASAQVRPLDPSWTAPPAAAARTNPLSSRPDAAAGGERLYARRCASCHGDDRRGTARGPDLAGNDFLSQSDGAMFWKITQGNTRAGMPTFSFLPEVQRWQLVLHLRAASEPSRKE